MAADQQGGNLGSKANCHLKQLVIEILKTIPVRCQGLNLPDRQKIRGSKLASKATNWFLKNGTEKKSGSSHVTTIDPSPSLVDPDIVQILGQVQPQISLLLRRNICSRGWFFIHTCMDLVWPGQPDTCYRRLHHLHRLQPGTGQFL